MSGYQNPILPGFHPDPSICRVGDEYFLVTSARESAESLGERHLWPDMTGSFTGRRIGSNDNRDSAALSWEHRPDGAA